jgi:hypothetical protein
VDVPAADGLVPLRAVYADGVPELDGSLAEPAWSALPWSPDFGAPAARVRVLWHLDTLYLAAWTSAPELQIALDFPGAARQAVLTARADGSVAGVERARCFARTHVAEASPAHAFEIAIPWSALAGAAGAALPPQPGALAEIAWRSGEALLRAHAVFEPSRAVPGSFGAGAGLSR